MRTLTKALKKVDVTEVRTLFKDAGELGVYSDGTAAAWDQHLLLQEARV